MNINHHSQGFKFFLYILMISLGILAGTSHIGWLHTIGQTIAEIFINIFKFVSIPIIALSIIVTLSTMGEQKVMKKLLRQTLTLSFGTTFAAAALSCVFYVLLQPQNIYLQNHSVVQALAQTNQGYLHYLQNLIPSNLISPFLNQQVMSVLLIAVVLGFAIRTIPDANAKSTVMLFFKGMQSIFFAMIKWIICILPLGLFGFTTVTVLQLQQNMQLAGLGAYLAVILLANLLQGLIILPLMLKAHGIAPYAALKKMLPALSVAFFSKSSFGTLPVTMNLVENKLNVSSATSRFVLPLCTSFNMNGCAAFIFATVIFVMQNQGIDITPLTLFSWVFIATIAAIGNAGVPMGCFFLSASLLSSMNVSIVLLGIILPFYSLIDMLETALNVWSDACITMLVDQKQETDTIPVFAKGIAGHSS